LGHRRDDYRHANDYVQAFEAPIGTRVALEALDIRIFDDSIKEPRVKGRAVTLMWDPD
jgi:hypothetical protein